MGGYSVKLEITEDGMYMMEWPDGNRLTIAQSHTMGKSWLGHCNAVRRLLNLTPIGESEPPSPSDNGVARWVKVSELPYRLLKLVHKDYQRAR